MNIQQWQDKVHNLAKELGWWVPLEEDPKNMTPDIMLSKLMLVVSELGEACEEVRAGKPIVYQVHDQGPIHGRVMWTPKNQAWNPELKPEGVLIELADAVIRIMDLCGFMGWNLQDAMDRKHTYNKTRAFRHGGKLV